MSIMTRHRQMSLSTPFADVCAGLRCEARPHPESHPSVPLCPDCLLLAALAYHACIDNHKGDQSEEDARRAAAGRLGEMGFVYFIRFSDRIKIGFTTHVEGRLAHLPYDEVLATFPGTMAEEKRCHKIFAKHRVTGEWFMDHPDIRGFIAACSAAHA